MSEQVPSRGEYVQAAVWLGRYGVRVGIPTRLLATRLGVRSNAHPWPLLIHQAAILPAAVTGAVGYQCLQYLPGVRGVEMTESKLPYFLGAGIQLAFWYSFRRRDRQAVDLLGDRVLARPRPSWRASVGGWYFASAAVTFAGGAALGVTMFVATPYRTYAWSWLGLLALSAVVCAVIVAGIVRRPVIAEDEPSAAVDALLRVDELYVALPSAYALPVLVDLRGRPVLPDGDYGVPLPAQAVAGWSPEDAR